MLAGRRTGEGTKRALVLGVLAGLGFGAFFILISKTSEASGLWPLAASKVASIGVALIVGAIMPGRLRVNRASRMPAIVAGVLDMGANVLFLVSTRIGLLAISGVVSSLYPAPTVLLAAVLDGQKLSAVRAVGLILALAGVALMTV